MIWNWMIACYLFLAGMGAGSFAFAIIAGWKKPEALKVRKAGMILGLAAVAVGTVMLIFDASAGAQHPLRFFYLLTNWSSVMTWGVALLSAFLLLGFIDLVLLFVRKQTPKALDGVILAVAAGVAVYTGLLLGVSSAYPLWNIFILPILFFVSALSAGFAAAALIGQLIAKDEMESLSFYQPLSRVLPVIEALLIVALLSATAMTTGSGATAATATVTALTSGTYAVAFWLGLIVVGLVVPFSIEIAARKNTVALGAVMTAETCVLVGGYLLRYLVIMAAVPIIALM
jgi:polysulfide reductase chain C